MSGVLGYQKGYYEDYYRKSSHQSSLPSSEKPSVPPLLTSPLTPDVPSKEPTFFKKLQQSLTRLNVNRSSVRSSFSSLSITPAILEEANDKDTMEGATQRQKNVKRKEFSDDSGALSDEWKKRLTDYNFLSGKEEHPPEARRCSVFSRKSFSKRSRPSSIVGSIRHSRNADQVCYIEVSFNLMLTVLCHHVKH